MPIIFKRLRHHLDYLGMMKPSGIYLCYLSQKSTPFDQRRLFFYFEEKHANLYNYLTPMFHDILLEMLSPQSQLLFQLRFLTFSLNLPSFLDLLPTYPHFSCVRFLLDKLEVNDSNVCKTDNSADILQLVCK
jgi:hypothetical protein